MRLVLLPLLVLAACGGDSEPTDTGDTVDSGPRAYTDVFEQTLLSPVDILWVIDSSWQKGTDDLTSELLNNSFETLLLADPSWRIGVLDSAARGSSFGLIRGTFETFPYPPAVFNLPDPAEDSKPRDAIYTALDLRLEQPQNKEFLRSDAHLYVLVYTDKEDASTEIDKDTFDQWLRDLQPSNSKRLSALTTPERSGYWADRTVDGQVVEAGALRPAIERAFREAMGQRISFTLTYAPLEPPQTVSVIIREHAKEYVAETDFTYDADARTLTFDELVPPPGAQIVVEYETDDEVVELPTESTPE